MLSSIWNISPPFFGVRSSGVFGAFWGLLNSCCKNTGEESWWFLHTFQSSHEWSLLKIRSCFRWSFDLFHGGRFCTLLMTYFQSWTLCTSALLQIYLEWVASFMENLCNRLWKCPLTIIPWVKCSDFETTCEYCSNTTLTKLVIRCMENVSYNVWASKPTTLAAISE